jgi:phosphate starvation-inducible PhoH-like protein
MPRPLGKYELFFGMELTDEQGPYVDSIFDNQITFVDAKSGTGKTTLAVASARILKDKNPKQDLYYIFSPVQEGAMGFRPGNQSEKEKSYNQPLVDALEKIDEEPMQAIFNPDDPYAIKQRKYWIYSQSHVFMRGTNRPNCTIIIDEAQNFTHGELKKVLTRIHDTSKAIVIGHQGQCDLKDPTKSGFVDYIEWFRNEPYCGVYELTKNFRGRLAQHADNYNEN